MAASPRMGSRDAGLLVCEKRPTTPTDTRGEKAAQAGGDRGGVEEEHHHHHHRHR